MQAQVMHESTTGEERGANHRNGRALTKTFIWVGVAGLSAALAFAVVRAMLARQPSDPTSQRIQHLIDEANQLLKTLDDQRNTG
ncbi:MAG: hypothetical protein M3Y18_04940 [Candidatus Eremiobacteraeota bacterium]|nr:hypothetical protein [Candidatus Eremiobacteraeota bacterium]